MMCRRLARLAERIELLDGGGEAVPALFARDDRFVRHPVHLDRAARAVERLVTVPRILRAAKGEEGAAMRWNFLDIVVEIGAVP